MTPDFCEAKLSPNYLLKSATMDDTISHTNVSTNVSMVQKKMPIINGRDSANWKQEWPSTGTPPHASYPPVLVSTIRKVSQHDAQWHSLAI
jgi:hypothetical protein